MKMGSVVAAAVAVFAAGTAVWWQTAGAGPNPPYPSKAELAALPTMNLPEGWYWTGNISSGGPPDGKNFGLELYSSTKLWQGERVQADEAEVMRAALTEACASLEFAQSLVAVRGRNDHMQDITDRQLVARVNWESAPSGTDGRYMQTFEVFYQLEAGVCGAVQPKGLIDSPYMERSIRHWIFY